MNFKQITNALKELSQISSNLEKLGWLKAHNDEDLKEVFKWLFDNSRISGIAEKKFDKTDFGLELTGDFTTCDQKQIQDVFRYLDVHHTGSDIDIIQIKDYQKIICSTVEEEQTFKKLVCKNYPIGIDVKTINKVFPGLIPTFDVELANKYFDKPELVDGSFEFVLQEKLDGCRCIAIKENGTVRLVSRQGKSWTGLVEVEEAVKKLVSPYCKNFILDGELLLTDRKNIDSKNQYKETTKIISTKNEIKTGITLNVFDYMDLDAWNKKECNTSYKIRYEILTKMFENNKDSSIHLVENIYVGNEPNKVTELLFNIAKPNNWEGLMIRDISSLYEWKRSNRLLKVKCMSELDAIVTGFEEGSNRNVGKLGALICEIDHSEYGNLKFKVGSGYSDDERIRFWEIKNQLVGRVISVQYFEVTQNTDTKQYSVRFPVFLELKEEGQKPNN